MAESSRDNDTDVTDMADAIVDAVEEPYEEDDDGLTKGERLVEHDKESERIRKAKELKKSLRKRELGFLNYRWPAMVLVLSGLLAVWTEFLTVTVADDVAIALGVTGMKTFWEEMFARSNIYFAFPIICGVILITLGIFAYSNPKVTYLSVIPAMLMASTGATVLFQITFAVSIVPDAAGHLQATGTPYTMLIVAVMAILSIMLREKE
ncbi:MAG: hypothetical protein ACTSV2_05385 [Candidatus Thorarchaeota archaeon]